MGRRNKGAEQMTLLRRAVDTTTLLIGRVKRNQRIPIPAHLKILKVNLGCGLTVAPDWINIDGSLNALIATLPDITHRVAYRLTGANLHYTETEYRRLLSEHHFVHHDLSYQLTLDNNVADFVYTSHFIEHLSRKDAVHLIKESRRILKPGGTMRISVPDLEYVLTLYSEGDKERMLSDYFFVDHDDSYYARHKYMYDYQMLSKVLKMAGFQDIVRCSFRNGRTPDLDILDNRPKDSLFIEAVK